MIIESVVAGAVIALAAIGTGSVYRRLRLGLACWHKSPQTEVSQSETALKDPTPSFTVELARDGPGATTAGDGGRAGNCRALTRSSPCCSAARLRAHGPRRETGSRRVRIRTVAGEPAAAAPPVTRLAPSCDGYLADVRQTSARTLVLGSQSPDASTLGFTARYRFLR